MAKLFYIIDDKDRTITSPVGAEDDLFGVFSDRNVERKYFKCKKIVGDNVDLSQCELFINYVSVGNTPGQYHCTDVAVTGEDITFSWLLSDNVFDTNKTGNIYFAVQARSKDGHSVFNTLKTMGKVAETVEAIDYEKEEKYADVILDLLSRVNQLEKTGIDLKIASEFTLGGVKGKKRTTETEPVTIAPDGTMWVKKAAGGGGTAPASGLTDWQSKKDEFSAYRNNTIEIVPGVYFDNNVVEVLVRGTIRPDASGQGVRMTFFDTSQKDWLDNNVNTKVTLRADWHEGDSSNAQYFIMHLQKVMHSLQVVSFFAMYGKNISINVLDSSTPGSPLNFIDRILVDNITVNDAKFEIYTKSQI